METVGDIGRPNYSAYLLKRNARHSYLSLFLFRSFCPKLCTGLLPRPRPSLVVELFARGWIHSVSRNALWNIGRKMQRRKRERETKGTIARNGNVSLKFENRVESTRNICAASPSFRRARLKFPFKIAATTREVSSIVEFDQSFNIRRYA